MLRLLRREVGIVATAFANSKIESNLDAIAGLGVDVVQLEIEPRLARRVGAAAAARGLRVAAVSSNANLVWRDGLHRLRELAAACSDLGTRTITLGIGTRDGANGREAWSDLLRSMEVALSIAGEFDVDLAVEPSVNSVVDSARAGRRLLHELASPWLKIAIDPGHLFHASDAAYQRTILDEFVGLLGEHIVLAHASDVHDDGRIDYAHFLRLLDRLDAPLILPASAAADARRSLALVRGARSEELAYVA